MYYGHSPDGYSNRNVFYYQTRSVLSVYDALTEAQQRIGRGRRQPGRAGGSVRFREAGQPLPGIAAADLTADQKRLVEQVMRDVLSPFRTEDANEVMDIVRRNGGTRPHPPGVLSRPRHDRRDQLALLAPGRPRLRVELPRAAARAHVREHRGTGVKNVIGCPHFSK